MYSGNLREEVASDDDIITGSDETTWVAGGSEVIQAAGDEVTQIPVDSSELLRDRSNSSDCAVACEFIHGVSFVCSDVLTNLLFVFISFFDPSVLCCCLVGCFVYASHSFGSLSRASLLRSWFGFCRHVGCWCGFC